MRPLAGVLAAGPSFPALAGAQSVPYPKYVTGPQPNGSWVVSSGQVITPAGTQVNLGIRVRAKAVRENRTYDQILGDVAAGNGDPSLAVFGDGSAAGGTPVTPNAHKWLKRFPLLDNFYDPSRQSADGHQWIQEAMAPYADDIQSPDWVRSYPGGNAGDALAYQNKGFLFSEASAAGLPVKIYGEYIENDTYLQPNGSYGTLGEPSWSQFYADSQCFEGGPGCAPPGTAGEKTLYYQNEIQAESSIPATTFWRIYFYFAK
jgi:hypothetical protein